jgi:hypothetical protein
MSSKAKVTNIVLAHIPVRVFLLPDFTYGYTYDWLSSLIKKDKTVLSDKKSVFYIYKLIKSLPDKDLTNQKVAVEGISNSKFTYLTSTQVIEALKSLVMLKVDGVLDLLTACALETLDRRADKAFGIQRSEEEYNERTLARKEGKESRLTFTNAIKSYIERNGISGNEAKFMYKNATDKLYCCLTGYSSTKKFREKENIPLKHSPREYASANDLIHTNEVESAAARWIYHKNVHPYDAVEYCANQLLLTKVGWNKQTRL